MKELVEVYSSEEVVISCINMATGTFIITRTDNSVDTNFVQGVVYDEEKEDFRALTTEELFAGNPMGEQIGSILDRFKNIY